MKVRDNTFFQSSLPKRQVIIAMAGTALSMFLGSLYMTLVATAMPTITATPTPEQVRIIFEDCTYNCRCWKVTPTP